MNYDGYRSLLLVICLLIVPATHSQARDYQFFDVHIHYSHDVWDAISPQSATQRLKAGGITRAMVSASGSGGAQRLYQYAPDFYIPALRPYRKRSDMDNWVQDESVIPYLESKLAKFRYVAIGEFHLNGAEAELPVVKKTIALAKKYNLLLHVHSDAQAIQLIYQQYPEAHIIWAHAGFEYASTVEEMLDQYPNLWADLSFRREIYINDRFLQNWRELLIKHADRFMVGVDTYTPQRWLAIDRVIAAYTDMLNALPEDVARKIAHDNAARVVAERFQ